MMNYILRVIHFFAHTLEIHLYKYIELPSRFHLRRWLSGRAQRAISSNILILHPL